MKIQLMRTQYRDAEGQLRECMITKLTPKDGRVATEVLYTHVDTGAIGPGPLLTTEEAEAGKIEYYELIRIRSKEAVMTVRELIAELQKVANQELPVQTSPCTVLALDERGQSPILQKMMTTSNEVVELEVFNDQVCLWREV